MRTRLLLSLFTLSISFSKQGLAQTNCHVVEEYEKLKAKDPNKGYKMEKDRIKLEKFIQAHQHQNQKIASDSIIIIPVVFHILHLFGNDNIDKSQVLDAIRIMNEDFKKLNADTASVVSTFDTIIGNMQMEFRLAQIDPDGNCTDGIVRYNTPLANDFDDNFDFKPWVQSQTTNPWAPSMYFNVYSMRNGNGAYATGPSSDNSWPLYSGVTCQHGVIGSIGTSDASGARYMTHETGHWVSLAHTWGGTNDVNLAENCDIDDGVADTPNNQGQWGCPLTRNSCTDSPIDHIDNVQNYMDYSSCNHMFTVGQVARAHSAFNSGLGGRNNLGTLANLIATGTQDPYVYGNNNCSPIVDFGMTGQLSRTCEGSTVSFSNGSYNGTIDSIRWDFPGGTPSTSTANSENVIYNNSGLYDVSLKLYYQGDSISTTTTDMVQVDSIPGIPYPFSDSFESMNDFLNDWFIENKDEDSEGWAWSGIYSYSGNASIKMDNNLAAMEGLVDELISPVLDLSGVTGTLEFRFMVAHAQRNGKNDRLKVLFSKNCGFSWSTLYDKQGATLETTPMSGGQFNPSGPDDWREEIIVLNNSFKVEDIRVKFLFTTDRGTNLFIDDINMTLVGLDDQTVSKSLAIFPNPIDDNSVIKFYLYEHSKINIMAVDILGKPVETVFNGDMSEGQHEIKLNNYKFPAKGVYFLKMKFNDEVITRKVIKH